MATLALAIGTDPRALLSAAAADFLSPPRRNEEEHFPTPPTLLVLRQGGLRDDLLRLAGEQGIPGWFDPPLCLFSELGRRLAPNLPRAIDPIERLILVESALAVAGPTTIGRADRLPITGRETDALFGELAAEGVDGPQFRSACDAVPERDTYQRERDGALADAWEIYLASLTARSLRDGRDTLAQAAAIIAAKPGHLATVLGGRRAVHILGLTDLRGGWRPLVKALRDSSEIDRLDLFTMHAGLLDGTPGLEPDHRPVVGAEATLASSLFSVVDMADGGAPTITVVDAPDDRRSIEHIAVAVRQLIDDGTPPHRIAVVSREARPFADRAADALEKLGVPVTARRRVALGAAPVIRLVRQLLEAAAEHWSRHALVELAEHPYSAFPLDASILNRIGYSHRVESLDSWHNAIDVMLADARKRQLEGDDADSEERRVPLPPLARLEALSAAFDSFRSFAATLDTPRAVSGWVRWLADFVQSDPWALLAKMQKLPAGDIRDIRVDLGGWAQLHRTLEAWQRALAQSEADRETIDASDFLLQFDAVLQGDVVLQPETAHGVVVSEGLAAIYRDFCHVFITGLDVGRFPRLRRSAILFAETERDALCSAGLPLDRRDDWDTRERELFRALIAGARTKLTLVSARETGSGSEAIVSSFVEEVERCIAADPTARLRIQASTVITVGIPIVADLHARSNADYSAPIERARRAGDGGMHEGVMTDPAVRAAIAARFGIGFVWSPTSLESLAKCGYAWFAKRILRLDAFEEPDDDIARTVRGSVFHDALARFYNALVSENGGHAVLLTTANFGTAQRETLRTALDSAFDAVSAREWMGAGPLVQARRDEWFRLLNRFIEWEAETRHRWLQPTHYTHKQPVRTAVRTHEQAFGPLELTVDGLSFFVRGSIDRIEVSVDERLGDEAASWRAVVDYKTTKSAVPGAGAKEAFVDGIVMQAPLYAAALGVLEPAARIARIEYRALQTAEIVMPIKLLEIDEKKGKAPIPRHNADQAAVLAAQLAAVRRTVIQARDGRFPASPAPSEGCPSWCVAIDICRVPGGPQTDSW